MVTLSASRKAYVFTMIAILLVTLMLIYVSATYRVKISEKADVQGHRISQVTRLVADIENQYLPTALISVSQDALDAMAETTVTAGPFDAATFIGDFEKGVKEGETLTLHDLRAAGLEKTLPEFLDSFFLQLHRLHEVDIVYSIGPIDLYHHDPWWLQARTAINYTLTDSHTSLVYTRDADVIANFSIINLQDPLYRHASGGVLQNRIEKSAYIDAGELDAAQVKSLMLSSNYTPDRSSKAWSYLERFVGKNAPALDCSAGCGIVSLLNPTEVGSAGKASYADYTFRPWGGHCQDRKLFAITGFDPISSPFAINDHFRDDLFHMTDSTQYRKISDEDSPTPTYVCEPFP